MFDKWRERMRKRLIERLRPGRDEEELNDLVERAAAVHSDEHRQMLQRLIGFQDIRVREIMLPRSAIAAVELGMSLAEVEQKFIDSESSRLPVMVEDLDHIEGVVELRDVFSAMVRHKQPSLAEIMRPCLKVSELQQVSGVLSEMRASSHRLAIVIDEYGGTAGLVTMADLLEEIVGPIDEQENEPEMVRSPDGGYIVQALMHVEDLEHVLDREFPEGDYDTVGGLVISSLGRIPSANERVEVAGMDMKILEADPRRVLRIRIEPPQP
jgi:CBS domain containing-hemolysin-like protein